MVRQQMFAFGVAVAMGAAVSGTSEAGWGSLGSYGSHGSSGGGYGSSGGSYGSSGGSYGSYGSKYYSSPSYSYGSYSSSGGSTGGSSGGSSGGWSSHGSSGGSGGGSVRSGRRGGLLARLFGHHRSRRASGGSSGASYGSYSSSGGSYGSYSSHGSSGGSYGSSHGYYRSSYGSSSHGSSGHYYGGNSGVSTYYGGYDSGQPVYDSYQGDVYDGGIYYDDGGATQQQQAPQAPQADPAQGGTDVEARVSDDTAILTVAVPADARVFVNDEATKSEGPVRQYISHGLREGYSYTYVVRVEQMVDGEKITDMKEVRLRAGTTERLVFDLPEADDKVATNPAETVLTLVVPEDAQVTLAGNATKVSGNVRTYRTTRLAPGEQWDNYTVRVTVNRGGREVSKEQTISLRGGSEEKLAFEFNETELASR